MKKKYFYVLPAILLLFAVLFSCRNDYLIENDAKNTSELPGLTSKIISLNESAHKNKIVPELKFAKQQLTKKSGNIFGKTVNFGDSISIDTQNVIYIENGPNYHTYTFNISRTNSQPNDPVENLLLTPLPDGTYKEFLVSYNFTEQEKNNIKLGLYVDRTNKSSIEEINGNFQNSLFNRSSCSFEPEQVIVECYSGDHHAGNISSWGDCDGIVTGNAPPQIYTIYKMVCKQVDEFIDISPPSGGGETSGGGGAGDNPENPTPPECETPSSFETPQDPALVGPGGCEGVPTLPNLGGSPNVKTPCEQIVENSIKAKEYLLKAKAAGRLSEVKTGIATNANEKSFSLGIDSNGNEQVTGITESFGGVSVGIVAASPNFTVKAGVHTHSIGGLSPPSAADIYTFMQGYAANNNFMHYYTITYDGKEYVFTITDLVKFQKFAQDYPRDDNIDYELNNWKDGKKIGDEFYKVSQYFRKKQGKSKNDSFELAMAHVLKKYNVGVGMSKKDSNGDFKPIFVSEEQDPANPKKKTYAKTDNCNL